MVLDRYTLTVVYYGMAPRIVISKYLWNKYWIVVCEDGNKEDAVLFLRMYTVA